MAASKYNVTVKSGSGGSVIVGDNNTFYIGRNNQRTGSAKPSTSNIYCTNSNNQATGNIHKIDNGYALVIHNYQFEKLPTRNGSEKDLEAIKDFCRKSDLTIDIQENLQRNQIRSYCRKLVDANENKFSNYDGFVCFMLSHGKGSGIYGVDDETISVEDIVSYFQENKDLLGKPKLFFIQACRVNEQSGIVEDGAPSESSGNKNDGLLEENSECDVRNRLLPPQSSDTLVAYSTIKGEPAFRNTVTGSYFIQTLIEQLTEHARSLHAMDIMTKVNNVMSAKEFMGKRQMPIQASTLRKPVYFKIPQ